MSRAKQTTPNHLIQAATTEPDNIRRIEAEISALKQDLERHRQVAQEAHINYGDVTVKCRVEWLEI